MVIVLILTGALIVLLGYGLRLLMTGRLVVGIAVAVLAAAGVVLVWQPEAATRIANALGVGRGADLLLYVMFVLLVILVLLIHGKFRRYDQLITELARSAALANVRVPRPGDDDTVSTESDSTPPG